MSAVWKCSRLVQPQLQSNEAEMYKSIFAMILLTLFVSGPGSGTDKKIILPPGAKAGGNYSQGILTGGTLYISGQGGEDSTGKIPSDFDSEVKQSLENIGAILRAAGMSPADVVSVQVYLRTPPSSSE
jgi:enamine deaminase RidA (YjgF/YER057c/UK114 family)